MKRAWHITINEVKLYLQDKGDLAFGILLPILTFALMYGAFGGQTLFKATATIVDEDKGVYAQELIQQVDDVEGISVNVISREEADKKLDRSDLLLFVVIPEGFSDELASGDKAEIIFRQRGNGGQEGQILASIVRGVAERINQEFEARAAVNDYLAGSGLGAGRIESVVRQTLEEQRESPSVGVTEEFAPGSGSADFVNQFLPGIVTMYVLFSLTLIAPTLVQERKRGTLERLLTTRLTVGELFFGKFLSIVGRGFLQTLILLALSYAVFQMFTPLSFLAALVIIIVFAASAAAIGIIIASLSRSDNAANWIAVVVTMYMAMMGGTFFEVGEGGAMGIMKKFSLNNYANEALNTVITESGTLGDAWQPLVILAAVAAAGMIISRLIFKAVPGSAK